MKSSLGPYIIIIGILFFLVYCFSPLTVDLTYVGSYKMIPIIPCELIHEIKYICLTGAELRHTIDFGYNFNGGTEYYRILPKGGIEIDDNSYYYISFNCNLWSVRYYNKTFGIGSEFEPESYFPVFSLVSPRNNKNNIYKSDTFMRFKGGDEPKIVLYPILTILVLLINLSATFLCYYVSKLKLVYLTLEGKISFKLVKVIQNTFIFSAIFLAFLLLCLVVMLLPS